MSDKELEKWLDGPASEGFSKIGKKTSEIDKAILQEANVLSTELTKFNALVEKALGQSAEQGEENKRKE